MNFLLKNRGKTFCIGDIHGGNLSLKQCLERSGFDKEKDRLISLGDIADGWPFVFETVEELMTIKNLIVVRGNHDQWLLDWLEDPTKMPGLWIEQGGRNSLKSYKGRSLKDLKRHKKFFQKTVPYFIDQDNRLYVHGGIHPNLLASECSPKEMMWDRNLSNLVLNAKCAFDSNKYEHISKSKLRRIMLVKYQYIYEPGNPLVTYYKEVFLGHSTTYNLFKEPISFSNVYLLDQGGGWEGVLTIMNVDTKQFWQSDVVSDLYPNIKGRA